MPDDDDPIRLGTRVRSYDNGLHRSLSLDPDPVDLQGGIDGGDEVEIDLALSRVSQYIQARIKRIDAERAEQGEGPFHGEIERFPNDPLAEPPDFANDGGPGAPPGLE